MAALLAGDVGSRGIGFLVTVYLARILGPAGFGLVSVGMALLGHLQLLASPGIQLVETRNTARPGGMDDRRVSGILTLRLVLSVILFGIAALVLFVFPYDSVLRGVVLWSLASLFPLAVATDWYLQGNERMEPVGLARFAGYVAYGLAAWMLVRSADDVAMAPVSFLLGSVVTSVMLWMAVISGRERPEISWEPSLWVRIFRENLPVGAAVFMGQMVINLPPVVLAAMKSSADAGIYNAAMKLVFVILIADRILNALLLPALTRIKGTKPAEFEHMVTIVTKVVLTSVVCILLLGNAFASWGVELVFGMSYESAGSILRILLLYAGITLVNSVASNLLLAAGLERTYSAILIRGSIVLVAAMVILTPLFGVLGTATGAVIGELVTLVLMLRCARSEGLFPPWRHFAGLLASGAAAGLAGWLIWTTSPLIAACAAPVVFAGLLTLLRVFKSEDLGYVKDRLV